MCNSKNISFGQILTDLFHSATPREIEKSKFDLMIYFVLLHAQAFIICIIGVIVVLSNDHEITQLVISHLRLFDKIPYFMNSIVEEIKTIDPDVDSRYWRVMTKLYYTKLEATILTPFRRGAQNHAS